MTKKDYSEFASMLTNRLNNANNKAEVNTILLIKRDMEELFKRDNDNFSAVMFEVAVYKYWNKCSAYMNM